MGIQEQRVKLFEQVTKVTIATIFLQQAWKEKLLTNSNEFTSISHALGLAASHLNNTTYLNYIQYENAF